MVEVNIVYQDNLRCKATHAPSGTVLLTDAPKDNQGKGESFSPTDLLATALGSCMLTVMGIAARDMGVDISGAQARVEKTMVSKPVRRIASLGVLLRIPAKATDEQKQKLEQAAMACPVHKSLHPDVSVPVTFEWV